MAKNDKGMIRDMTVGSVPKNLLSFAGPLMISGALQTAYNMVDMVVVGQYVGSAGLSAVSIGGNMFHFLTFIAMGISNAGQILISKYVGANALNRISKMIGTLFTTIMAAALIITTLGLILRNQLLSWINTPPEAWDSAMDYVVVCMIGMIFVYGYNLVSAILRGMGDSKHPMIFIAIASIANVILDLLFVAVFHMGALGAALATVIGQAISFIWSLIILYGKREEFHFDFRPASFKIDGAEFRPLMALGIPMMLQSAAISISALFVNSFINSYGVQASAVTGMAQKLSSIVNIINHSFSTGGATMIGQNIGAGKYERVPQVMKYIFLMCGVLAVIMSVLTVFFPRYVYGIFTSDQETLKLAVTYVPVAVVDYFGAVLRPVGISLINGSGNSRLNLAVGLLDGIVMRIGLTILLGLTLGFGIYGFWYGNALAGYMPFVIGMAFFFSGKWKK